MTPLPSQPNQSLLNGIAALQAVVTADAPVGSREVARLLDLEHTKVNRLLGTLCHLGLLERTQARKYRPGSAIHVLSAQSLRGSGLLAAAIPALRPLSDTRLTIAMGVLWNTSIAYLVHAAPGTDPADAIAAHRSYPAHQSVIGLGVLMAYPDGDIRKRFSGTIEPKELSELLRTVAECRSRGFVRMRVERTATWSISVPVGDAPVSAVGLAGIRDTKRIRGLSSRLKDVALAISGTAGE